MRDVTKEYVHMIEAFECDFTLAKQGKFNLNELPLLSDHMSKDIELLQKLSFGLRHGSLKIIIPNA